MTDPVQPHPDGALLLVKAQPSARQAGLGPVQDGWLKVRVTEIAERGTANRALCELLAKQLGLKKSQVALLAGQTSSHKRFVITGITPDELRQRLGDVIPPGDYAQK